MKRGEKDRIKEIIEDRKNHNLTIEDVKTLNYLIEQAEAYDIVYKQIYSIAYEDRESTAEEKVKKITHSLIHYALLFG